MWGVSSAPPVGLGNRGRGPGAEGEDKGPCLPTSRAGLPAPAPAGPRWALSPSDPSGLGERRELGPTFLGSSPQGARVPVTPPFLARPFNPAKESRRRKSCAKAKSAFHLKFPRNQTYYYILLPTYLEPLPSRPGCGSRDGSVSVHGRPRRCGSRGRPGTHLPRPLPEMAFWNQPEFSRDRNLRCPVLVGKMKCVNMRAILPPHAWF